MLQIMGSLAMVISPPCRTPLSRQVSLLLMKTFTLSSWPGYGRVRQCQKQETLQDWPGIYSAKLLVIRVFLPQLPLPAATRNSKQEVKES